MSKEINSFNLRVYALIIDNENILISKELIKGEIIMKFPGGGVEHGEGILEALQRESKEELMQGLKNISHFYTTDFFQKSSFNPKDQIISIYYKAQLTENLKNHSSSPIKNKPIFEWKNINHLKSDHLQFPIDKHVLNMIKKS
jgi:8-oxo-dGTP diphosphatase